MKTARRAQTAGVLGLCVLLLTAGCSWKRGGEGGRQVSAFDVKPGDCVVPPTEVHAELSKLKVVPCTSAHTQEAYALVTYKAAGDKAAGDAFPGDATLKQFADGACAEHYRPYVGIDYQDSALFFTYLLPSARGWQQGKDRDVLCLVTTTGEQLTASVKDSRR